MKKIEPWTDQNGELLSDIHLKIVSKYWDGATWEAYLENYSGKRQEMLVEPKAYDKLREENTESVFNCKTSDRKLRKKISAALERLTPMQKLIIRKIFFENLSGVEVAELTGLSRKTINTLKKRALRHLKNNPQLVSDNLRIVEGKKKF